MERNTLIAVYGTLRKGNGNHRIIENAKLEGTYKTDPIYNLHSLGGFPGLKNGGNTSVTMEVYSVNEEEARRVDSLEGYTPGGTDNTFYDKEMIDTPFGKAGVYIFVRNLSNDSLIESGDWMNRHKKVEEEV